SRSLRYFSTYSTSCVPGASVGAGPATGAGGGAVGAGTGAGSVGSWKAGVGVVMVCLLEQVTEFLGLEHIQQQALRLGTRLQPVVDLLFELRCSEVCNQLRVSLPRARDPAVGLFVHLQRQRRAIPDNRARRGQGQPVR